MNGKNLNQPNPQRTPSKYINQAFSFLNSYETDIDHGKPKLIEDCEDNSEYRIETFVDNGEDKSRSEENGKGRGKDVSESRELGDKSDNDITVNVKTGSVLIRVSGDFKSKAVIEKNDLKTGTSENGVGPYDALSYEINPVYEVTDDVDNKTTGVVNGVEGAVNDGKKSPKDEKGDGCVDLEKEQPKELETTCSVGLTEHGDSDDMIENQACFVKNSEDANISITVEEAQDGLSDLTENGFSHIKDGVQSVQVELRKSLSPIDRATRQPTWKVNQHIVSEAFHFLANEGEAACTESMFVDSHYTGSSSVSDRTDLSQSREPSVVKHADCSSVKPEKQEFCENGSRKECDGFDDNDDSSDYKHLQESNDKLGDLQGRRRRGKKKAKSVDDDDDGSSDEDRGVYRESFRNSKWLFVGEVENVLTDGGPNTDESDNVFPDESLDYALSPLTPNHKRNISTSTTASESAFRNHYSSISKRFVQRAKSQEEYKRYTTTAYDNVKVLTMERDPRSEFGIHVLDCKPAVISRVDKGSPAEKVGLKDGQVLISVNGVNVLELDHQAIVDLVLRDSRTLTVEVGNADLMNIIDLQEPVKTGFLHKQTTSIFKSWKKRYFILRKDGCLYYYKTDQETDPLGAIPLSGYVVTRYGDLNKFGFKAEKFSSKTMHFSADSRADMTCWVEAMNEAAKQDINQDPWLDVTAQNVGLPALSIKNADCCGNLQKMTRSTRRWRKRYCVLKDACIYYYKSCQSREADGVAHLHGYKVDGTDVGGKKFSFSLIPPEPQMRRFNFCTNNDTDKLRWIRAFNKSIKKWVKVE